MSFARVFSGEGVSSFVLAGFVFCSVFCFLFCFVFFFVSFFFLLLLCSLLFSDSIGSYCEVFFFVPCCFFGFGYLLCSDLLFFSSFIFSLNIIFFCDFFSSL